MMTIEIICPNCNFSKKVPEEKIPRRIRYVKCPQCKESFAFDPLDYVSDFKDGGTTPPVEDISDPNITKGLFSTLRSVLFSPKKFFSGMDRKEGLKEPLAFGLLFGSIGNMFAIFWQFLMAYQKILSLSEGLLNQASLNLVFIGLLVVTPFFVVLDIFVTGGIIHLLLIILRADKGGFEGSLRVIAYSQAAKIFSFIPFLGGLAGWLWNLIIVIIGLRDTHGASYARVTVAILIILFFKFLTLLSLIFMISKIYGSFTF